VTDIDEILSQLNPKLRKKISLGSDIAQTEFAKTPSFGLNRALGGGLPYGRQILIYGNKSSGKSSFCLQTIAEAQAEGKVCAWIDAGRSSRAGGSTANSRPRPSASTTHAALRPTRRPM
jgi:recombination protein RecA